MDREDDLRAVHQYPGGEARRGEVQCEPQPGPGIGGLGVGDQMLGEPLDRRVRVAGNSARSASVRPAAQSSAPASW
jgi:hypothetical protein